MKISTKKTLAVFTGGVILYIAVYGVRLDVSLTVPVLGLLIGFGLGLFGIKTAGGVMQKRQNGETQ
jgi:hypothetical protein